MKKKVDGNIKSPIKPRLKEKVFNLLKYTKNQTLKKIRRLSFEWFPFVAPSKLIIQISPTFSRILGRNNFIFESFFQFSSLLAVNYLVYRLHKKYQEHFVELLRNYNTIQSKDSIELEFYQKGIIYANLLLTSYIASEFVHILIDKYFTRRLSRNLQIALDNKIFSDQTLLAIAQDADMQIVIKNLRNDVDTIVEDGGGLLTSAIGCVQNAILSFPYLLKFSQPIRILGLPDLVVYSICYGSLTNIITSYFVRHKKLVEDKLKIEQTKLDIISTHAYANIKTITERQGLPYIQRKQNLLRENIYVLKNKLNFLIALLKGLSTFNNFANGLFRLYIIGKKMFEHIILIAERSEVELGYFYLQTFFSWSEINADGLKKIETPLKNINAFLEREKILRNIQRKIIFREHTSSSNKLIIADFMLLTASKKKLVKIDSIRLKLGERYLVTGASGAGKSTLLSKINKIVADNFDVSGTITYPKLQNGQPAKLCMISQNNYFHPYDTLLENICFPETIPKKYLPLYKEKIIKLLRESRIEDNSPCEDVEDIKTNNEFRESQGSIIPDLEKENIDWNVRLSGGQIKKILIISAIIQKPDILILDEIFAGLDKESIQIMQVLLLRNLPDCLMLIVDHHGLENNYQFQNKRFYNNHLNISHQSIRLVPLGKANYDEASSSGIQATSSTLITTRPLLLSRKLERKKDYSESEDVEKTLRPALESETRSTKKTYCPSSCTIL